MVKIERTQDFTQAILTLPLLQTLDAFYPDIGYWYVNTVLPGVVLGSDSLLLATEADRVVAFALGKKTPQETKLRCVRVLPQYQQSGLGIRLIDRMLEELEDRHPHVTVAEELFHQYSRLFVQRYGFRLDAVEKGLYRPGKLEYLFNGGTH